MSRSTQTGRSLSSSSISSKIGKRVSLSSGSTDASEITEFVRKYKSRIQRQLHLEEGLTPNKFLSFAEKGIREETPTWLEDNEERFFKKTPNRILAKIDYLMQYGYITAMCFSPDGEYIVVGHINGLIQVRHGRTGEILKTLRKIQFPPKAVYAIVHSKHQPRTAYAACTNGIIYKIEIPETLNCDPPQPKKCIQSDPAVEHLAVQYYDNGESLNSVPFIDQRYAPLALDISADGERMIVGFDDTSVRIFDMTTAQLTTTYKVAKARLQLMSKKLRRVHCSQVAAVATHQDDPTLFGTGGWDETLRIWDDRTTNGCTMTFEGVNVISNSIDFCRQKCICGSWKPVEALTLWDLTAQKRSCIVKAQNRRPDVDGEYIHACQFWKSSLYNRKGKYVIIGGSGTNAVEVINLHNRYITCAYPQKGSTLALTSYQERIAFGGTATTFQIVEFHDPKHETYDPDKYKPYGYTKGDVDFGKSTETIEETNSEASIAVLEEFGENTG